MLLSAETPDIATNIQTATTAPRPNSQTPRQWLTSTLAFISSPGSSFTRTAAGAGVSSFVGVSVGAVSVSVCPSVMASDASLQPRAASATPAVSMFARQLGACAYAERLASIVSNQLRRSNMRNPRIIGA